MAVLTWGPGLKFTGAHSAGSQDVVVETEKGKAILCGDSVLDIPLQIEGKHPSGRIWMSGYYHNLQATMWELYKLKKERERGTMILASHAWEVFDEYKLGKRLGDKRRDYEGFSTLDWPPGPK